MNGPSERSPSGRTGSEAGDYAGAADAHLDLRHRLSYAEYLGLDAVLASQRPRTDAHDELLFIIQHQATELWVKLVLHELHAVAAARRCRRPRRRRSRAWPGSSG